MQQFAISRLQRAPSNVSQGQVNRSVALLVRVKQTLDGLAVVTLK